MARFVANDLVGFLIRLGSILRVFSAQSTIGFTISNHGNPKITFSFPKWLIKNSVEMTFPSIFTGSRVRYLIGPFLFRVSSTFETGISFFSFKSGSWCSFANHSSINTPWVPQSISALVSTIFFPSKILVSTVIDFESLSGTLRILRALTESSCKGLVVVASLCTKNPQIFLQLYLHLSFLRKQSLLLLSLHRRVLP